MTAPIVQPASPTLLCTDVRTDVDRLAGWPLDHRPGGAAVRTPGGGLRRVEPGPLGPLTYEVERTGHGVEVRVWGPSGTPADAVDRARTAAAAFAGLDDDPAAVEEAIGGHPVLRPLLRRLGAPRLGRVPRVGEAVGRAVIGQLVQAAEAARSCAQLRRALGEQGLDGMICWPTASTIGATPAWALRRCGISLRGARALHAAAMDDPALTRAVDGATAAPRQWEVVDARIRALPGCGAWTSGETRLALGDPDAVSVGDYHLPSIVGTALNPTALARPRADFTDDEMLAALEPFAGQRGRVVLLITDACRGGLARRPQRRAPRAAFSVHRYW